MRNQGEARFTGRWQDRSTSTSIVLDSIAKQRPMSTRKAPDICMHCRKPYTEHGAGQYDDLCMTWSSREELYKPDGSGNKWTPELAEAILDNSRNKPEYSPGFSAIVGITLSLGTLIGAVVYELVRHGH